MMLQTFLKAGGLFLCMIVFLGCVSSKKTSENLQPRGGYVLLQSFDAKLYTKSYIRLLYPELSDEVFETKWKTVRKQDPFLFFRSFVRVWYKLLEKHPQFQDDAAVGVCYGDAHIENFGFLYFDALKKPYFVYNDFDDTCFCPQLHDILRYVTSLRLAGVDENDIREILLYYVDVRQSLKVGEEPPKPWANEVEAYASQLSWQKSFEKFLKKNVENQKFVHKSEGKDRDQQFFQGESRETLVRAEWQQKLSAYVENQLLSPYANLLDSMLTTKFSGGSGGVLRYSLLVGDAQSGKITDVWDVKEWLTPAYLAIKSVEARGTKTKPRVSFLESFKAWKPLLPVYQQHDIFFLEASFDEKAFVLRSRIKEDVEFFKLSKEEKRAFFLAEVYLIAAKDNFLITADFADFVLAQSRFLQKAYEDIFEQQ